jgi:predicted transcriptional regulator
LDEIYSRLLSSDTKVDLLTLFHNNPGLSDTIESVARRIGRTANEIEADVKDLVDLGLLTKEKFGTLDVVSFNTNKDKQIQENISNQIKGRTD